MSKYAAKWMGSLHDYDRLAYADKIYQLSREITEDHAFTSGVESGAKEAAEQCLRCIIKLGQTPVVFTVFEEVFRKWLDLLPGDHRQVCRFYPFFPPFLTDDPVLPATHPSI